MEPSGARRATRICWAMTTGAGAPTCADTLQPEYLHKNSHQFEHRLFLFQLQRRLIGHRSVVAVVPYPTSLTTASAGAAWRIRAVTNIGDLVLWHLHTK